MRRVPSKYLCYGAYTFQEGPNGAYAGRLGIERRRLKIQLLAGRVDEATHNFRRICPPVDLSTEPMPVIAAMLETAVYVSVHLTTHLY